MYPLAKQHRNCQNKEVWVDLQHLLTGRGRQGDTCVTTGAQAGSMPTFYLFLNFLWSHMSVFSGKAVCFKLERPKLKAVRNSLETVLSTTLPEPGCLHHVQAVWPWLRQLTSLNVWVPSCENGGLGTRTVMIIWAHCERSMRWRVNRWWTAQWVISVVLTTIIPISLEQENECFFPKCKLILSSREGEFPGSPVVRTQCFHGPGPRFNPWLGN